MADLKISQLPAATTPVAGTEELPIVQSATTKKVSIADLTDGRAIAALSLTTDLVDTKRYIEGVVAIGTVGASHTIDLTNGTVQTATLTASSATTFTMPTATAGTSFILFLKQAAATGNGTATFTGVKWNAAGAPTVTALAGTMDIFSFFADGTNWYGSVNQGFTP